MYGVGEDPDRLLWLSRRSFEVKAREDEHIRVEALPDPAGPVSERLAWDSRPSPRGRHECRALLSFPVSIRFSLSRFVVSGFGGG